MESAKDSLYKSLEQNNKNYGVIKKDAQETLKEEIENKQKEKEDDNRKEYKAIKIGENLDVGGMNF